MKKCSRCNIEKNPEAFYRYKNGRIRSWCRQCDTEHARLYRRKNNIRINQLRRAARTPEKIRKQNLRRTWKLSLDEWNRIFDAQGRQCAICHRKEPYGKKGWSMDHNHETGQRREILCHLCNHILGNAKDNIEVLQAAIQYLSKHGGKKF